MNKTFLSLALCCCVSIPVFSKEAKQTVSYDFVNSYEYRVTASQIQSICEPVQKDDFVVFTAKDSSRHVGIVFDFEDYKTVHSYQKKTYYDEDGKQTKSLYFYILELPQNVNSISYRLIVDGIWTTDPTNSNQIYDPYTGITVSYFDIINYHAEETAVKDNGVHFIYKGKSGQVVRIAGTFSNWDSSIYQLTETTPGFYEISIPLPEGIYYYNFYIGTKVIPDSTNHDRAYSNDGRITSKLVVKGK